MMAAIANVATDRKVRRSIVVPLEDNDGVSLATEAKQFEALLLQVAGGFSRADSSGVWIEDGQTYEDKSTTYSVTVSPVQNAAIVAALPAFTSLLRQLALYTEASTVDVSFISPSIAAPLAA